MRWVAGVAAALGLALAAVPATAAAPAPLHWTDEPRALSASFIPTHAGGEVVVTFAAPVAGAAPVRVLIELDVPGRAAPPAVVRARREPWLTASWPAAVLPAGARATARMCAVDAADRLVCAAPAAFVAPGAAPAARLACGRRGWLPGAALLAGALLALAAALRAQRLRAARLA